MDFLFAHDTDTAGVTPTHRMTEMIRVSSLLLDQFVALKIKIIEDGVLH